MNNEGLKTRLYLSIYQGWFQLKKDFSAQEKQDTTHILEYVFSLLLCSWFW